MYERNNKLTLAIIAAILTSGALTVPPARATDFSWDGNFSELWDRETNGRTNWDPQQINNPIPGSNDNVFFGDIPAERFTVQLNGNRTVNSINFSGNVDYTLIETNIADTLTLASGALTASGDATFGIDTNVTLQADAIWDVADAATWVYVTGVIRGNAYRLHKTGAGTLKLNGGFSYDPSKLRTLRATAGDVVISTGYLELSSTGTTSSTAPLSVQGGDITIQNGADVQFTRSLGFVEDSTLTLTGSGSLLGGPQLDAGEFSGTTGNIVVENGAWLDIANYLVVGVWGDGDLKVRSGATAEAGIVILGERDPGSDPALGTAQVTGTDSLLSSNSLHLGAAPIPRWAGWAR